MEFTISYILVQSKHMNKLEALFKQIVVIDSPSGYEKKLTRFIINFFKERGINDYYIDKTGNLLIQIGSEGKPLLISAHLDTVEPGCGIKPILKNGYWQSDGSTILGADNKSTLAAILFTLDNLLKIKIKQKLEIIFTVKEEVGDNLTDFPFKKLRSKVGIIFDNANPLGGIVLSSPEIINFQIDFLGKASHSSRQDLGINALSAFQYFLQKIKLGFNDNKKTTINIGKIEGGTGINIIPEKIIIQGEIRSFKKKFFQKQINLIKNNLKTVEGKFNVTTKIDFNGYLAGYDHKKNDSWLKFLSEQIKKQWGVKPSYYKINGVSDANYFNHKGIKVVNLADGVTNAHSVEEKIKNEDIEKITQLLKKIINGYKNFIA